MKVRVDAAADDGDCRDTSLFEWHVIAAGEKSVHIEFVSEPRRLSRFQSDGFLQSCHTLVELSGTTGR